jgi:hypothetical protein
MKVPSTGNFEPSGKEKEGDQDADHFGARSKTRTSVDGAASPRLPHERDESSDSGTGAPSDVMHIAREDAESDRVGTDKGEATNAAYDSLRSRVPGKERDSE